MKTTLHLPIVAAVAAVLMTTGCQQMSQQRQPEVSSAPAPAPKPPTTARQDCEQPTPGHVRLSKQMPKEVSLGQTFEYQLMLAAQECLDNVVVTDQVPAGASYVKSEPSAEVDGGRLVWKLSPMDLGQTGVIKVTLKAEKEGTLSSCATVSADPRVCGSTFVGKPMLAIDKSGPETAILGSTVTYTILVSNKGSSTVRGVVVTDTVPDGLESTSGQKEMTYDVGDLAANQSKTITVPLRAAKRGKFCNKAMAKSTNAGEVSDEACTTVMQPGLKIVKTGDKERFIGRNANYRVVVSNIGDTPLTDVIVVDTAPSPTRIVSASGGTVSGNTATWRLASLPAGEEKSFDVVLTSPTAGNYCNGATVTAAGGLRQSAEACTLWSGVGAVLLETVDDPDPIQVEEQTVYTIRVTNQGTADLTNLGITAVFAAEITPVNSPQGTVTGQTVKFPNVARLAPKQNFTYTIRVKGAKPGDARNSVSLTADGLTTPVVEEESTRVY